MKQEENVNLEKKEEEGRKEYNNISRLYED